MGTLDLNVSSSQCRRCGKAYGRLKGNFPASYAHLYKGVGFMPYCRSCVDEMYDTYLLTCKDPKKATRQMCRKLDLYWNEAIYEYVSLRSASRSIMTAYIQRTNSNQYIGKSYDDTLSEEDALWESKKADIPDNKSGNESESSEQVSAEAIEIAPEIVEFWGADYSPDFLLKLNKRYKEWTKGQEDLEPAAISLFKHICILEETIAIDSAAGRPFDKNLNTLNGLLGSLNMKPVQKKDEAAGGSVDNSPMGVWIRRFENERPIPEPDPELRDVDKIVRYIQIFFLGHLAKMLGKTTVYSRMYEEEIARLRVESPELSGEYEDDNDFIEERFSAVEDGENL